MAINITLAIAWDGGIRDLDTDDIVDVFRYDGEIPPAEGTPWIHLHVLNAPWDTLVEAKDALLEPNAEDEPPVIPPDYIPVVMNPRKLRVQRTNVPPQIVNAINKDRQYQFDFNIIADAKVYNKKLQRLMELIDW